MMDSGLQEAMVSAKAPCGAPNANNHLHDEVPDHGKADVRGVSYIQLPQSQVSPYSFVFFPNHELNQYHRRHLLTQRVGLE